MTRPLDWGSSKVDWCEGNFNIVNGIAEFYNTISNVLFLIMPPLLMYLFRQYSQQVTRGVHLVWALLFTVGVGSVYFHMTLSLVGQLIDEIAILWVLMAAIAVWLPLRCLPSFFKGNRKLFQRMLVPLSVISTGLCCVLPQINALVLMLLGIPIAVILVDEYKRSSESKVRSLAMRSAVLWFIAVVFWVNDKFLCEVFWYHFPYLHSGWHILIFISSYTACVLFAYFQAKSEAPHLEPKLRYWPRDTPLCQLFAIPYVALKCEVCTDEKTCKNCVQYQETGSFYQNAKLL